MSDKVYFTATDPEGRTIHLYENTWRHIKDRHPEIRGVGEVKSVIQKPQVITENTEQATLAYTKISRSDLYVNVYARMDDTYTKGSVRTAFLQPHMPKGDVIWTSKK